MLIRDAILGGKLPRYHGYVYILHVFATMNIRLTFDQFDLKIAYEGQL